jgi:hypothetical protein
MPINAVNEADLFCHDVKSADPSMSDATRAAGDLIVNVVGGEHRLLAPGHILFVQTVLNPTLAVGQLLGYLSAHSKSLLVSGLRKIRYLFKPRKTPRDFVFFSKISKPTPRGSLG